MTTTQPPTGRHKPADHNSQANLAQTGPAQTGPAQTKLAQAGNAQTGPAQAGNAQTGPAQAGNAQTGPAQTGPAQTGPAQAGHNRAEPSRTNHRLTEHPQRGHAQPEHTQTEFAQAEHAQAERQRLESVRRGPETSDAGSAPVPGRAPAGRRGPVDPRLLRHARSSRIGIAGLALLGVGQAGATLAVAVALSLIVAGPSEAPIWATRLLTGASERLTRISDWLTE